MESVEFLRNLGNGFVALLGDHLESRRRRQRQPRAAAGNRSDQIASGIEHLNGMNPAVVLIDNRDRHFSVDRGNVENKGCAANAHGCDRGRDLHVAGLGDLAGDEAGGTLHQGEQRCVRCAVRVVSQVVQHQPRVRGHVEGRSVDQHKTERRTAAGLHHIVLVDRIAVIEIDGDAVADDAGAAGHLDDMTDHLGCGGGSRGLGVLNVSGQCFDDFGIERRTLGRDQRWTLIAMEVIRHHHAMVVIRNDQVGARTLIVSGK